MGISVKPLFFLLLVPALATAQVYKGVGPDGTPVYSDRPLAGAQVIQLSPAGPKFEAIDTAAEPTVDAGRGIYTEFAIASPADNAVVRSPEGSLQLSLALQPSVQPDHRLMLLVDGAPVPGELGQGTQMRLSGLALGTHRIRARIIDAAGATVAETPLLSVHMRPSIGESLLP
jgi:hypothetical protein